MNDVIFVKLSSLIVESHLNRFVINGTFLSSSIFSLRLSRKAMVCAFFYIASNLIASSFVEPCLLKRENHALVCSHWPVNLLNVMWLGREQLNVTMSLCIWYEIMEKRMLN